MLKRASLLAAAGSMVLAGSLAFGLVTTASAAGKATPVTFKGKIACTLVGTVKANPALGTTKKTTTITVSGTLSKCTGTTSSHSVKIKGGTFKGTSKASVDCSSLITGLPKMTGKAAWKTSSGSATATTFSFSNGDLKSSSPVTFAYPGTTGTAKTTGSFAGKTASATIVIKQAGTAILAACSAKGVSSLTITSKSNFKA